MFKNPSKLIFLSSIILGTLISISSNSWLGVWIGLEINLLSFIPLMINTNNLISTEASLKYFLTQAFASSILLFSIILFITLYNFNFQINQFNFYNLIIFIPLLIKRGVAPFHFWFPNVIEGINWISALILITWQKIAPLLIISYLTIFNYFYLFIILSAIIGALGGLNQTSIRKIIAFSSINHLGWILTAIIFNENLWIIYFFIYSFISLSLTLIFNHFKLFFINQIFNIFYNSIILKFFILTSFLSLAGLPPFLGFLPKWLVIQSLITINQYFLTILLIFSSLITIYFYLRICYSAFILNYTESSWNQNIYFKKTYFLINMFFLTISIRGLLIFINISYNFY